MSDHVAPTATYVQADAASLPLADESVDLVITSPPYNLDSKRWTTSESARRGARVGNQMERRYRVWQQRVLSECHRVARTGASLFYVHTVRVSDDEVVHPVEWLNSDENPWLLRQEIVWNHGITPSHERGLFRPVDERVYWLTKGRPDLPTDGIRMDTVWETDESRPDTDHPAPFPEALPKRCLRAIGEDGDVVLDPMAGSMTTCKAASALGYRSIGVDVTREYMPRRD